MPKILNNIALSGFVSYRIGGHAKYFAQVESVDDLISVLKQWKEISKGSSLIERIFVLGGGTNVLFSDNGYDGLVILNKIKFIENGKWKMENGKLHVGSGVLIEDLLNFCIENSLSGLSWAGGLPGTIGGAIRGNAGAFGGEIKDSVFEVASLKYNDVLIHHYKDNGVIKIIKRKKKECKFGYRSSVFKNIDIGLGDVDGKVADSLTRSDLVGGREIIVEVVLSLKNGNKEEIENQINEKIEYRKQKHPSIQIEPNIGSTFKNIPVENLPKEVVEEFKEKIKTDPFPVLPAVKLIAGAGMTGERVGDIVVSPKHPNYLVNAGHGKSSDVLSLISKIKTAVKKKYLVVLEEEITIIG